MDQPSTHRGPMPLSGHKNTNVESEDEIPYKRLPSDPSNYRYSFSCRNIIVIEKNQIFSSKRAPIWTGPQNLFGDLYVRFGFRVFDPNSFSDNQPINELDTLYVCCEMVSSRMIPYTATMSIKHLYNKKIKEVLHRFTKFVTDHLTPYWPIAPIKECTFSPEEAKSDEAVHLLFEVALITHKKQTPNLAKFHSLPPGPSLQEAVICAFTLYTKKINEVFLF